MAGSVNKVILVGNLGRDPEVRTTQTGGKIVNMTLATSESWTDKASGEKKERTEWVRVVIFNDHIADIAERYCQKGSKVYIEGSLQTRKYTDQGVEKFTTEVVLAKFRGELVLLSSAGDAGSGTGGRAPQQRGGGQQQQSGGRSEAPRGKTYAGPGGDLDDEIPF